MKKLVVFRNILITGALLSLVFGNGLVSQASAYYNEENTEQIIEDSVEITDEVIARIALDFAENAVSGKELTVNSIIPIKNIGEEITGYDVGFDFEGSPHGYVIIDLRLEGDYIAEFNLNEGVSDFYSQMLEKSDKVESIPENEQVIVETIPTEYNVVLEEEVINSNGKDFSVEEYEEYEEIIAETSEEIVAENENYSTTSTYEHTGHVLRNYPGTEYSITSQNYLSFFNAISEQRIESLTGKYACAVQAMTTIASSLRLFEDWKTDELKNAYNRIWTLSGTSNDGAKRPGILAGSMIQYGVTPTNNIGTAIVNFAKEKSKINLSYNVRKSPTFISIQTDIKNKRPVAYSYWVKNSKGKIAGHTVFVQGTMTGKKGDSTHNFILLADGWGYDARYMNYSTIPQTLNGSEATSIYGKAV